MSFFSFLDDMTLQWNGGPAGDVDLSFSFPMPQPDPRVDLSGVDFDSASLFLNLIHPDPAPNTVGFVTDLVVTLETEDFDNGFCFADETACATCPCGNDAEPGARTGCWNSLFRGARLAAVPSLTNPGDWDLRVSRASIDSFGILISGDSFLSAPNCLMTTGIESRSFDGLRCLGGNVQRRGARLSDGFGNIGIENQGWSTTVPDIVNASALVSQTQYFQVVYRDGVLNACMSGQNTTNAVAVRPNLDL